MSSVFLNGKKVKIKDDAYFRQKGGQKVVAWLIFAVFGVYVITLLYPFAWLFINSFRTVEAYIVNPNAIFTGMTIGNYIRAFGETVGSDDVNLFMMFFNSFLISTGGTLLTVITSSCVAYIMSKFHFRGRKVMFSIIVFSMILPVVGTLPALLDIFDKILHIHDTYFALLFLYSGGMGGNFILLYSFFQNISWQYAEAGYMDGASEFRVFVQIMMPLAMPAVTSIAVLTWIGLWNEYVMPRVLMPSQPTIAVGLYELFIAYNGKNNPLLYSTVVMSLVPIITIFAIFQKTIMTNTVAGGLKG